MHVMKQIIAWIDYAFKLETLDIAMQKSSKFVVVDSFGHMIIVIHTEPSKEITHYKDITWRLKTPTTIC